MRVVSAADLAANAGVPWVTVGGRVYDVSSILDSHPGGRDVLLTAGGSDGTGTFEAAGHSARARRVLGTMLVGELQKEASAAAGASDSVAVELDKHMSAEQAALRRSLTPVQNAAVQSAKFAADHPLGSWVTFTGAGAVGGGRCPRGRVSGHVPMVKGGQASAGCEIRFEPPHDGTAVPVLGSMLRHVTEEEACESVVLPAKVLPTPSAPSEVLQQRFADAVSLYPGLRSLDEADSSRFSHEWGRVPCVRAAWLLDELEQMQERGELTPDKSETCSLRGLTFSAGFVLAAVQAGSPAARAGCARFIGRFVTHFGDVELNASSQATDETITAMLQQAESEGDIVVRFGYPCQHLDGNWVRYLTQDQGWQNGGFVVRQNDDGSCQLELNNGETHPGWPMMYMRPPGPLPQLVERSLGGAIWHAARREAMLREHPNLEALQGYNPWSLLVALAAVSIHTFSACYCFSYPGWMAVFAAAYTIGACCRMAAFAMGHEFCHGVVANCLNATWRRRMCIRVCTLPSCGNAIYEYYSHHHLSHHALVGTQGVLEAWDGFLGKVESDGDLFHPYALLLRNRWSKGVDGFAQSVSEKLVDGMPSPCYVPFRCFVDSFLHVCHLGVMVFWVVVTGSWWGLNMAIKPFWHLFLWVSKHKIPEGYTTDPELVKVRNRVRDLGKQAWLSVAVFAALVALPAAPTDGRLYGGARLLIYLSLSELFLNGFLMHPFGAYFLGAHLSEDGVGPLPGERGKGRSKCQPTRSCYASKLFSLLTWNLTHHVEHHDFPGVPWNRLPRVTATAPEFYNGLATVGTPVSTLMKYVTSAGGKWAYACVC